MRLSVEWKGSRYEAQLGAAIDLSLPVDFAGEQPTFFGLPAARQVAIEAGDFVGDTERGGSCNCRQLILCPHGNGTHTESYQHVTADAPAPAQVLDAALMTAQVITVSSTTLSQSAEHYSSWGQPDDRVISCAAIKAAIDGADCPESVILRTRPNGDAKRYANYDQEWAPYLTYEAIDWLHQSGLKHLIVDLPSIDRHDDGGELPNHHRFWGALGARATLTELAYIPDEVDDGLYLLNLQLPHLLTDAVPSRPVLIPLLER